MTEASTERVEGVDAKVRCWRSTQTGRRIGAEALTFARERAALKFRAAAKTRRSVRPAILATRKTGKRRTVDVERR